MTQYHLYHHDDLDGVTTGAVLLYFLKQRGDDIIGFHPVDYAPGVKEGWAEYSFQTPFIIVDFLYHPRADWWLDHHGSSFIKPEWQNAFVPDAQHEFDPAAKSCCGQVLRFLTRQYGAVFPDYLKTLAAEVDINDSGSESTIKDAIGINTPARKISCIIAQYLNGNEAAEVRAEFTGNLIQRLAAEDAAIVTADPMFAKTLQGYEKSLQHTIEAVKAQATLQGVVVKTELDSDAGFVSLNHIPFYVFPTAAYQVTLFRREVYIIRISVNKLTEQGRNSALDLGAMGRQYDGGGHKGIGILRFETQATAVKKAEELVQYLNTNG